MANEARKIIAITMYMTTSSDKDLWNEEYRQSLGPSVQVNTNKEKDGQSGNDE